MKGERGFTLIEPMVVVAIVGGVSAIPVSMERDDVEKTNVGEVLDTMRAGNGAIGSGTMM